MMCTESNQKHRVQQQDHSRIRLTEAVQEDSEDEAEEEALHEEEILAKVVGQSLVIIAELQDTMLGTVKAPLLLVIIENLMIIP